MGITLRQLFIGPLNREEESMKVSKFILSSNQGKCWNLDTCKQLLPPWIIDIIMSIPLHQKDCQDLPAWPNDENNCTVKEAYNFLADIHFDTPRLNSKWVWKLEVSPTIQMFIWKLLHQKLPVKDSLPWLDFKNCPTCNLTDETHTHFFQHCFLARKVWSRTNAFSASSDFYQSDWEGWIKSNATSQIKIQHLNISWGCLFIHTLWQLWITRNNRIFNPHHQSVSLILKEAFIKASVYTLLVQMHLKS